MSLVRRLRLSLFSFFILSPVAGAVQISVAQLDFGSVAVFGTSPQRTITFTNTNATKREKVSSFTISRGDFRRVYSNCPEFLQPLKSCYWQLSFNPSDLGQRSATITLWTTFGTYRSTLSGRGVIAPSAKFGPKKWHPGHYMQIPGGRSPQWLISIIQVPEMQGALLQYDWSALEPSQGVYNFSSIENELAILKANGKRMAIMVTDKEFRGRTDCVPIDMQTDPTYQGGEMFTYDSAGGITGCIAKRWIPAVMDRFIALHRALGERFDPEPYFEAVTTEETAAIDGPVLDGLSNREYVDQLKRLGSAMAEAYPHTLAEIWVNWTTEPYTTELVNHLYHNGIGIGGPDTTPTRRTQTIPVLTAQYAGRMPMLTAVQPTWLTWKINPIGTGALTLDEVYDFAISRTGAAATHLYWWYFEKAGTNNSYDFYDTVNLIRARGGAINRNCPADLICDTD